MMHAGTVFFTGGVVSPLQTPNNLEGRWVAS